MKSGVSKTLDAVESAVESAVPPLAPFVSEEISSAKGSINKRIEIWSLINDPDISKPDLIAAQKEWIKIQQATWPNVHE